MGRYNEDRNYTRLGSIYHNMKTRCTNPNYDKYEYYGGKGISICDEWMNSYDAFEEWALANGYTDELTLDRIDVNGNYTPKNCRWITWKEQANNKTTNRIITYNNETHTLQEWADKTGILCGTIARRLDDGWSVHDALTKPVDKRFGPSPITYNGITQSGRAWSRMLGLSNNAVKNRILRGWTVEQAVTIPAGGRP